MTLLLDNDARVMEFDEILFAFCVLIQPTQTQVDESDSHYYSVGKWVDQASDPMLHGIVVQAQGSRLLLTLTRPYRHLEFDIDLLAICDVDPHAVFSHQLFAAIRRRIEEHGDLKTRLEVLDRCLRLSYVGQFHLDVVPACLNPAGGLFIPDRSLRNASSPIASWKLTFPFEFAEWFDGYATIARDEPKLVTCKVNPLPQNEPAKFKTPLRHVVQIFKRVRDVEFLDQRGAPSSIFLTTLCANHYNGSRSIWLGLQAVVDGIASQIQVTLPNRIQVLNPHNLEEDFAGPMSDATYSRFCEMIFKMQKVLGEIEEATGYRRIEALLSSILDPKGGDLVSTAIAKSMEPISDAKNNGTLRVVGPTAAIHIGGDAIEVGKPVRRQTDFGGLFDEKD